ncbi:hypothetical protein Pcinc_040715 [Petrolisthes cinctipes]|uniref:FYVE-type domain-containing protein n=1 Tax=Petrolisthes cinctipes TaxID=88211 RepID=A0AAE1BP23_PETCI|nr:hypothetical protein Pcinc_040715 [Petrolisthes cinctipes]
MTNKTQHNYNPLLRFLFKNEVQISLELEGFLNQSEKYQRTLSLEAVMALKEKLVSHPQEAVYVCHQLLEAGRKVTTKSHHNPHSNKKNEQDGRQGSSEGLDGKAEKPDTTTHHQQGILTLKKILVECLDQCMRRVENLEEKLHREEEEYSALLKRQQKPYSPMRSSMGKVKQQNLDSAEASKFKERMMNTKARKMKNETLFYKLLSLSSDAEVNALCELFPRILKFCYENKLFDFGKVHYSLLSSSKESLQVFCLRETEYLLKNFKSKAESRQGLLPFKLPDTREIYHQCVRSPEHILELFYKGLSNNDSRSMMEIERDEDHKWLVPFWPLLFLHILTSSQEVIEVTSVKYMQKKHQATMDPALIDVCHALSRDMSLVHWCLARGCRVLPPALLQVVRNHTPLYVIHRFLPLHTLVPSEVQQVLQEHCLARDKSSSLLTSSKSTYTAFQILYLIFEVIGAGMMLDNIAYGWQARKRSQHCIPGSACTNSFQDRQTHTQLYKQNIADKLILVQNLLDTLQPLKYRLEILEDIYSLLFVQHSDISDEEHSESGSEEGNMEQSFLSQTTDPDSLVSTQISVVQLKPSAPKKSHQNKSSNTSPLEQSGSVNKGKEISLSEYVVLDDRGCEERHSSNEPSAMSSKSADNDSDNAKSNENKSGDLKNLGSHKTVRQRSSLSKATEHSWEAKHRLSQSDGWTGNQHSSCNMSGKSTTSSVSELPRTGYLINTLAAWDIMLLLRDSLLAFTSESFKQNAADGGSTRQSLQRSVGHLSRCVNEGLWRLQVIVPGSHTFATPDMFDDFLDGSLLSNAPHSVAYEDASEDPPPTDTGGIVTVGKKKISRTQESQQPRETSMEHKSVINYLFAPTSSLISLSLANSNVSRTEQIFHTYKVPDTTEKREAHLAVRLSQLRPKLSTGRQKQGRPRESRVSSTSQGPLHNLGLLAREGTAQVGATNLIHDLVTSSPPPVPQGIPEAVLETGCPIMASFLTPQALVLTDLSLTVDVTETTATYLNEQALQRQTIHNSGHEKHSEKCLGIPGYIPLLKSLGSMCNSIAEMRHTRVANTTDDTSEGNLYLSFSNQVATPFSLLISSLPLQESEMKSYITGWSRVFQNIFSVQKALALSDDEENEITCIDKAPINLQKTHVQWCYKALLQTLSVEAPYLYYSTDNKEKQKGQLLGAFVRSFYQYLQLLAAMVIQHTNRHFLDTPSSYFTLLTQRPVHILGSLMFQQNVDPTKLEPIASKMRLNLTPMILQYCCPKFEVMKEEIHRGSATSDREPTLSSLGCQVMQESVILNAGKMTCQQGVGLYGEVVVRDILTTLLSGLRETVQPVTLSSRTNLKAMILSDTNASTALASEDVQTSLKDTTLLAAVDFKKMPPGNETAMFFVNLANLMYIHAGILNHVLYVGTKGSGEPGGIFSRYQLERIFAMKRIGYVVGELGFLSLYDILYTLLPLQNPLSSILIENDSEHKISLCESELMSTDLIFKEKNEIEKIKESIKSVPSQVNFCVTRGNLVSPSVQVLYTDRMMEQIEEAVQEHNRFFLLIQESQKEGKKESRKGNQYSITTTRTVLDHLAAHTHGLAGDIHSIVNNMPEDVTNTLHRLKSELSSNTQLNIDVLDRYEKKGIVLEFIESFEERTIAESEEENSSEVDEGREQPPELCAKVPQLVLEYLRRQCPLLAFIVQVFHNRSNSKTVEQAGNDSKAGDRTEEDYMDSWLNLLYPPAMGVKPPTEATRPFATVRNLVNLTRPQALADLHQGNRVASALSGTPDISMVWALADQLLGSGAVTRNLTTGQLAPRAASLVTVIQALPPLTTHIHPELLLLLDHLLAFLVTTTPTTANPPPWTYARQVSDSSLRYILVHEYHRGWPVEASVELLTLLAHDPDLTTSRQDIASRRANLINLYNKIVLVDSEYSGCWQDVEKMSNECPSQLLHHLIHKKQFNLSIQWSEYHHTNADLRQLVDQSYLMDVLDRTNPDFEAARKAINSLAMWDVAPVVGELLHRISCSPTRRFLIEEFVKREFSKPQEPGVGTGLECQNLEKVEESMHKSVVSPSSDAPLINVRNLLQEMMGLILLEDVAPPSSDRFQLSHLVTAPQLIIEQWLMNVRLDAVERAVKALGPYLDMVDAVTLPKDTRRTENGKQQHELLSWCAINQLCEVYAAKALDTSGVQLTLRPQPASTKPARKFLMPSETPQKDDWVPDAEVRQCPVCEEAIFSIFCRRHHCRRCGRVVCGRCSQHRLPVQGYDNLPVRVCRDCHQQTKEINLNTYIQVRPLRDSTFETVSVGSAEESSTHGGTSWASDSEGGWYLSTDTHHNDIIRNEFCFDYAPSLSLCLAVLALHRNKRDAALCIIKLSHHLFLLITSSLKLQNPNFDLTFVLSIIQTLLTSAKLRFGNVGESQGVGLCEYYTQWVDLLSLLLKSNCSNIISQDAVENMLYIGKLRLKNLIEEEEMQPTLERCMRQEFAYMRRLRDTLVKKHMWGLALDISTKAGLETNGVWGAWAMASLKAGDFPGARERFSRVLERPSDKNLPCKSSLLPEVIKYLETNPFKVNQEVLDKAQRTRANAMMTNNPCVSHSQALVVLHTLNSLHKVAEGSLTLQDTGYQRTSLLSQRGKRMNSCRLEPLFQVECKYYLSLYGSHAMTLRYFMRHRLLQESIEYLLAEDIKMETFMEEVLVPCLKCGQIGNMITCFSSCDPHMIRCRKLMFGACRWLERQGWWHSLLALQEALGDKIRAAMTLLRMYTNLASSYSTLVSRSDLLATALSHLQAYLDEQALSTSPTSRRRSPLILDMSPWQVNQTINLLSLQADVSKFLAENEAKGSDLWMLLLALENMDVGKENVNVGEEISGVPMETVKVRRGASGQRRKTSGSKRETSDPRMENQLPTLLSSDKNRLRVAILVVCGGYDLAGGLSLAYRIVERTKMKVGRLVTVSCRVLGERGSLEQVEAVVRGVQEWEMVTPEICDAALRPVFLAISTSATHNTQLDSLAKLLSSVHTKLEMYLECGRLRSAYLVAVHSGGHQDVQRVKAAADSSGQAHVAAMCSKWLRNYHAGSGHSTPTDDITSRSPSDNTVARIRQHNFQHNSRQKSSTNTRQKYPHSHQQSNVFH